MKKITLAKDVNGRDVRKGDTVMTLNGELTGKVCDIAMEDQTTFVQLRPMYQPYGIGVWHAADRLIFSAAGRKRKTAAATSNN